MKIIKHFYTIDTGDPGVRSLVNVYKRLTAILGIASAAAYAYENTEDLLSKLVIALGRKGDQAALDAMLAILEYLENTVPDSRHFIAIYYGSLAAYLNGDWSVLLDTDKRNCLRKK